jgi:hypothetical protein
MWMAQHRGKIRGVMIGVGAGFDYHAGHAKPSTILDATQRSGVALSSAKGSPNDCGDAITTMIMEEGRERHGRKKRSKRDLVAQDRLHPKTDQQTAVVKTTAIA